MAEDKRRRSKGRVTTVTEKTATIHELVARWAREQPDASAVVGDDETLTYAELDARADRLAGHLAARGVGLETRVAVSLPRGPAMVVAFLATLKAGGTYVPLDSDYPEQRRAFVLADAGIAVLVTDKAGTPAEPGGDPVEVVVLEDLPATEVEAPRVRVGPDAAAYVVYTSGSTGQPKGVVVPHAGVVRLTTDPRIAVRPGQTVAQLAPAAFDASVFEIWGALCSGGQVVIMDARSTVAQLGAELRRWRPDWLFLTTGLFHLLAQHDAAALDAVGCLLTGGDVLSPRHIRTAAATQARVYAAYGPTETTVYASLHHVPPGGDEPARVPIGTPLTGKTMYVLGPDLRPVPAGEVGEIYLGGTGVARGYHGRPALTAERFLPDPFGGEPGARMYRTGDLGCVLPDGSVDFRGRVDRQVKVRGFRIELGEIESTLLSHPDLGAAVVVAVADDTADKRLAAHVVPAPGRRITVAAVRDWLGQRLPAYMIPATFVTLDELPLDPNGKPDRSRLPNPFAARAELTFLPPYVPPKNEIEQVFARAWADVLTMDVVGIDDDFYLLGGDSLRSVAMLEQLRTHGIELDAVQFFNNPTIRELAAVVDPQLTAGRAGG